MAAVAAAALLLLPAPPAALAATPAGEEITRKLIESQGTPSAAKPGAAVPFAAPGISAATRGEAQEQGTTLRDALEGAARQAKESAGDPGSRPFGISKGPLVKEARKMRQPGDWRGIGRRPSEELGRQTSESRPEQVVRADPARVTEKRGAWYPLVEGLAGKGPQ